MKKREKNRSCRCVFVLICLIKVEKKFFRLIHSKRVLPEFWARRTQISGRTRSRSEKLVIAAQILPLHVTLAWETFASVAFPAARAIRSAPKSGARSPL